ncbi:hypothetical protein [Sphingomonas sanxanigenens]|uniref:Uncharacterized protein n=1 Tax=Sphingomonas sanxanigenens DSM 19645 = NX02 TaxID=1123269 RepID=W0AGZ3_9SPHN|nr:hypothetical protein [Sphingomonas sanxanigenens]AHE54920.1 hypothetical protein NX02_16205 [Sphingomonas sanxanigenens DSM 19645 = NX02]
MADIGVSGLEWRPTERRCRGEVSCATTVTAKPGRQPARADAFLIQQEDPDFAEVALISEAERHIEAN